MEGQLCTVFLFSEVSLSSRLEAVGVFFCWRIRPGSFLGRRYAGSFAIINNGASVAKYL